MPKQPKPNGTPGKKPPAVSVKETAKPEANIVSMRDRFGTIGPICEYLRSQF
jgi:hypothetical protein